MRHWAKLVAVLASSIVAGCAAQPGEGELTGESSETALTAATFNPIWARSVGGGDSDGVNAATRTTDGRIVTVGSFDPAFQETGGLGGQRTHFPGGPCLHVAAFDANGAHVWSRIPAIGRIPEVPELRSDRLAVFPSAAIGFVEAAGGGDVIVGGWYHSAAIDLGTGVLRAPDRATNANGPGDYTEIFVARFDASGSPRWAKAFGGAGTRSLRGLSVSAGNDVVLAVSVDKVASFGGAPVPVPAGARGATALVRLDGNGAHVATKLFPALDPIGVGVLASGEIVLAGNAYGSLQLDGTRVAYDRSVVLARLDASFAVLWAKGFDKPRFSPMTTGASVRVAPSGDTILTGNYFGSPSFGGSELSSHASGTFVAAFDPSGAHRYSLGFQGSAQALSVAPGGASFLTASMYSGVLGVDVPADRAGLLVLSLDGAGHVERATALGTTVAPSAILPLGDGTQIMAGRVGLYVLGRGYASVPVAGVAAREDSNLFLARARLR